jgi:hypothetical protein
MREAISWIQERRPIPAHPVNLLRDGTKHALSPYHQLQEIARKVKESLMGFRAQR